MKTIARKSDGKQLSLRLLAAAFFCFFLFGLLLPYTHDDWTWGTATGLRRLSNFFANYNGRYLSNLLVLVMTRWRLLRALVYALALSSILWYATKLAAGGSLRGFLAFLLLFLCMPHQVFAQTLAWTSGFANYTLSLALLLPLLHMVQGLLFPPVGQAAMRGGALIALCLLSFCCQLLVEQSTLYLALFLAVAFCYDWYTRRRISRPLLLALLCSLLGAALMFSNTAYVSAVWDESKYQTLHVQSLGDAMEFAATQYFSLLYAHALTGNLVLALALSACLFLLLWRLPGRRGLLLSFYPLGFAFAVLVQRWLPYPLSAFPYGPYLEGIGVLLYVLLWVYALWKTPPLRRGGLFFLCSALALVAPLLLASPVGPRNFLASYVFLSMLCVYVAQGLARQSALFTARTGHRLQTLASLFCVLCAAMYLAVFAHVALRDHQRIAGLHRQAAQGEEALILRPLPFAQYLHGSSPSSPGFVKRFLRFYGLPADAQLVLTDTPPDE